ncbi:MAG: hypothetical protein GF350_01300 [Chitinivibrionales bacterium]|nr:hypothetical protein [Chitinivibrionales bacterium]
MKRPSVVDKRNIRLEEMMKKEYIPFLGGRPKRRKGISGDDITNLTILLNTSKNFDDFLKNA